MEDKGRDKVAIVIEDMWSKLKPLSTKECCIYKVPKRLRKLNPNAYTPKIVSIGPFHHKDPQLLKMEDHKQTYCKNFIEKRSHASLDDLIKQIRNLEPKIRRCYSENIKLSVEEFIKVILVDCCFTIELLLRDIYSILDDISIKPWLMTDISWDLILIENQLPFFIFQKICNLAFPSGLSTGHQEPFLFLSTAWYSLFVGTQVEELAPTESIEHFTDLYRYYHLKPSINLPQRGRESLPQLYSTTQLKEAGVKFRVNKLSKCFVDLHFSRNCLRIPQFMVEDDTEMILRNIIAFEQCHYPEESYFTDYVELLDCLINTDKDVDILVNNDIIVNLLGDSMEVARMFNSLCKNVIVETSNNNYLHICQELKAYCKHPWHRSLATLRRDYCNTRWKTVATFAAIFLLLLTITQTVFSILQVV